MPEVETSFWVDLVVQERANIPRLLATWGFNLDNIGAQISHQFPAELGVLAGQF
jgi:hypothetical protein